MLKTSCVVPSPNRQKARNAPGSWSPRLRYQAMVEWQNEYSRRLKAVRFYELHSNRECGYCQRHRINRCFCAKCTGGASDQLGARDSREFARVLDFSGNERSTASYCPAAARPVTLWVAGST